MNVDVVVVTYESAEHITRCLQSLPEEVNAFVIDNASSDASAAIARRSSRARVVENPSNVGFGAAANQGAALGTSDFVLFLNPDAVLRGGCLERLVGALRADSRAALAGPRLLTPDGDDQRAWWAFPSAGRSWLEAFGGRWLVDRDARNGSTTSTVPFVVGACLLVRRAVFEAVGGFDETFWLYAEEADLARRIEEAGSHSLFVPHAVCEHIGGASGQGSDQSFEEFHRGTERFVLKHGGTTSLVSYRLALFVGSLLRLMVLAAAGRASSEQARTRQKIVRRSLRVLRHPTSVPASRSTVNNIVLFSLEPWDEVWRRNQFLVRELFARDSGLFVLFVEPPRDVLHDLRSRRRSGEAGLRDGALPRLTVYRPNKILPRVTGPAADRLLRRSVRRAMTQRGMSSATLWVNDPAYAGVAGWGMPLLYDLTDDWTKATRSLREHRRLRSWDDDLTRRADVVVACSEDLFASHSNAGRIVHIPNAVDVAHFRDPQPRPEDLPAAASVVYVGTLHEDRLDVDLVAQLASALPEVAVVLVGPNALSPTSDDLLRRQPNVAILGSRPYETVPAYLQHANVVIIPHVVSGFTRSLDPIKAYECLAVGCPTVATPVAGFVDVGPPVTTVSRSGFVEAVKESLEMPRALVRREVPTWAERAAAFQRALVDAGCREASSRPLSVVYVNHCAKLSGGELALARLIAALDLRAHVVLGEDGPLVEMLRTSGASVEVMALPARTRDVSRSRVRPFSLPLRPYLDAAHYSLRLARRLLQLQPDLVHTNSLKSAFYGGIAARLARFPVLVHVRDRIAPDYLPRSTVSIVRGLLRLIPTAVVANSEATLRTLALDDRRTAVVPSPVIYDAAAPVEPGNSRQRHVFTALMVGRIAPWKGQDVFLRGFASAFPDGNQRALVVGSAMFGEDAFDEELRRLAAHLRIADRVEFCGFRTDVADLLAEADVLVHASVIPEPFGQVVVEGMAAGVAVVASDAGGPSEVISNGVDGLLTETGNVEALAAALRQLFEDPDLRERLAAAGRHRAEAFRPEVVAAQVMDVYRAIRRPALR